MMAASERHQLSIVKYSPTKEKKTLIVFLKKLWVRWRTEKDQNV